MFCFYYRYYKTKLPITGDDVVSELSVAEVEVGLGVTENMDVSVT